MTAVDELALRIRSGNVDPMRGAEDIDTVSISTRVARNVLAAGHLASAGHPRVAGHLF